MSKVGDFTSDGFDLDNLPSGPNSNDAILELGGEVSRVTPLPSSVPSNQTSYSTEKRKDNKKDEIPNALVESDDWKAKGNVEFKAKNYLGAYEYYSNAIESCPGEINGEKILELKKEFEEAEREKANEKYRKEQQKRMRLPTNPNNKSNDEEEEEEEQGGNDSSSSQPAVFKPPHHPYAKSLSIYHSNRAATLYHLTRYSDCIQDCTISILFNPSYIKPLLRRSAAYEATEHTEDALADIKTVCRLEPSNKFAKKELKRLEKLEAERLEKLKEETMGKLKDLGNSILGNFGLSLDNFQANKDPNTGSYNISFNNGK